MSANTKHRTDAISEWLASLTPQWAPIPPEGLSMAQERALADLVSLAVVEVRIHVELRRAGRMVALLEAEVSGGYVKQLDAAIGDCIKLADQVADGTGVVPVAATAARLTPHGCDLQAEAAQLGVGPVADYVQQCPNAVPGWARIVKDTWHAQDASPAAEPITAKHPPQMTRREAADLKGVHRDTIENARKRGDIIGDPAGKWYLTDSVVAWKPQRSKQRGKVPAVESDAKVAKLLEKLEKAKPSKHRTSEWKCPTCPSSTDWGITAPKCPNCGKTMIP